MGDGIYLNRFPAYSKSAGGAQGGPGEARRNPRATDLTECFVPRWLLILGAIALIALVAGYITFGGANMGR